VDDYLVESVKMFINGFRDDVPEEGLLEEDLVALKKKFDDFEGELL
jgi:hypothetical protein